MTLTIVEAAEFIADLATDDGNLDTEYTRGQLDLAVALIGYADDGYWEAVAIKELARKMIEFQAERNA